jgi:hypothetical protein
MAGSTHSEKDEKIALGKMQIKMAHSLFVGRLAFRETNGDGYCCGRLVSRLGLSVPGTWYRYRYRYRYRYV